jgi:hypothetical protein
MPKSLKRSEQIVYLNQVHALRENLTTCGATKEEASKAAIQSLLEYAHPMALVHYLTWQKLSDVKDSYYQQEPHTCWVHLYDYLRRNIKTFAKDEDDITHVLKDNTAFAGPVTTTYQGTQELSNENTQKNQQGPGPRNNGESSSGNKNKRNRFNGTPQRSNGNQQSFNRNQPASDGNQQNGHNNQHPNSFGKYPGNTGNPPPNKNQKQQWTQPPNNVKMERTDQVTAHFAGNTNGPSISKPSPYVKPPPHERICLTCGRKGHNHWICSAPREHKVNHLKYERRCHNCLRTGHMVKECSDPISCKLCGKRHHTVLDYNFEPNNTPRKQEGQNNNAPANQPNSQVQQQTQSQKQTSDEKPPPSTTSQ